jgi:bacillithiol system protein YtxJ
MNWNKITQPSDLEEIVKLSNTQKVLVFKHSTTCSISAMALSRLERAWKDAEMQHIKPYYLDLLSYRSLSNQIAQDFGVKHESPQVLLIEKGKCIFNDSHGAISYQAIKEQSNE